MAARHRFTLIAVALFVLCFWRNALPAAEGDEKAPVAVTVFYSKDDLRWVEAEKAIDAVAKKFPRLQIAKISIDDAAGYQKLADAEKNLKIEPTGDVTLVMGPLFLTSQGDRRDVEKHFGPMTEQIFNPGEKKGRKPIDIGAYAAEFFGKDAGAEAETKDLKQDTVYYQVKKDGRLAGWVVDVFREIRCPMCTDTQFLLAIGLPELKVLDVRPILPLERISTKLDDKETAGFVNQFKNRTGKDPDQKIDIISGATKTSRAYEAAMNEILQTLKKRQKE